MEMNTLSKIVNESSDNSSEEDVDDYKEEYEKVTDLFYHCAHCEYKSIFKIELNEHMEREHDDCVPVAESGSMIEEEDMNDAIEVWKIYKLLQRIKNKY